MKNSFLSLHGQDASPPTFRARASNQPTVRTKPLTRAAAGLAISLCALSGALAQTAPNSPGATMPTNLAGIRAHVAPPAGFNPLTASAETLQTYGYPPQPDPATQPAAFKVWARAVSSPQTRIIPQLVRSNLRHGPAQILRLTKPSSAAEAVPQTANVANGDSNNWSGFALVGPNKPFATAFVYAEYIVPKVQPPSNATPGSLEISSQWVGIDGAGSNDVLQAGTATTVYTDQFGNPTTDYVAWFEWAPDYQMNIANFPVSGGDVLFVQVWPTSPTDGHAYLANHSTKQAVSVSFKAPPGTTLIGNSMEWIVERPTLSSGLAPLPNYGACPFGFTYGANASTAFYPGVATFSGTVYNLRMTNVQGKPISLCTLMGPQSLWFLPTGSAL